MARAWWERLLTTSPGRAIAHRLEARSLRARFPGARLSVGSALPAGRIAIGAGTYGRPSVRLFRPTDEVTIGRYCSIAEDVLFLAGGGHDPARPSLYPFRSIALGHDVDASSRGPIAIGHDVWIGARATILSGVTVGDGAIIGACAVVTRDVPSFAIAAGNPARVVRFRFSPEQQRAMAEIAWWAWSDELIERRLEDFYLPIDAFIAKHLRPPAG